MNPGIPPASIGHGSAGFVPCPKSWKDLVGDHRVRYCGECRLNVYNLGDMGRDEAERLVRKREGRLCIRVYVRTDQTATVEDCRGSGLRRRLWVAVTIAAVLGMTAIGALFPGADESYRASYPAWLRTVVEWFLPPTRKPVMGTPPPPPPRAPLPLPPK